MLTLLFAEFIGKGHQLLGDGPVISFSSHTGYTKTLIYLAVQLRLWLLIRLCLCTCIILEMKGNEGNSQPTYVSVPLQTY